MSLNTRTLPRVKGFFCQKCNVSEVKVLNECVQDVCGLRFCSVVRAIRVPVMQCDIEVTCKNDCASVIDVLQFLQYVL